MKNFLRHNGIWVIIIALLLTAAISVGSVFLPNLTAPATHALGVLATPFRAAATFFADRVEAAYDYAFRYQALVDQVERLEAQVAEMSEENRTAQAALDENERLRDLLKLRQARADFTFESATVTGRTASSWADTLTISKGSASGVEKDMCVVTENGYLVGVVTDVGPNWATVTTLIDPNTSIGAAVERTGDAGILTSDLDSMSQGRCRLTYLDSAATLTEGDTVVTSGRGGVYPAGITVGTVLEEGYTTSGMERYAVVAPTVELGGLKQVFVIKAFDVVE